VFPEYGTLTKRVLNSVEISVTDVSYSATEAENLLWVG
jgi:hypothetical protein